MTKSIPALIFGVAGVIIHHDNDMRYQRLAELLEHNPAKKELVAFVAESGIGVGRTSAPILFEKLTKRYGSKVAPERFLEAWTCDLSLNTYVYNVVYWMKARRPVAICSNMNAAHWEFLKRLYQFERLSHAAILSHECGYEMPCCEIFQLAAAALSRQPNECLFIDSLPVNVEAAKRLGFQTHLFSRNEALRRVLDN